MKRFVRHTRSIIERAPLQVYTSALIYSPEQSLVRKQYEYAIPEWIINPPDMRKSWSPLLQTLGGYEAVSDISHIGKGLALTPDGKLLATPKVEIWDTTTGTLLNTLKPMGVGCSVSFSEDGKEVISLSKEGNLKVWDVSSGRSIKQISSPIRGHWALAQTFSVDKTRTASYSLDGTLVLFDIKRGKVIKSFKPHKSKLLSMTLSPNGELLATLCTKGTVRIWNTMDATLEHSFEADKYVKISTGKESKFLISSVFDQRQKGEIKWWDWASGTAVKTVNGGGQLLQLSPCGRLLASAQDNESHHRNLIKIWDAKSGELLQVLDDSTSPAKIFEFSNNGSLLATRSAQEGEYSINIWNRKTGELGPVLKGSGHKISCLAFSPDEELLAVTLPDRGTSIWSLSSGKVITALLTSDSDANISHTVWSPDTTHIGSVCSDGTVLLWDTATWTLRRLIADFPPEEKDTPRAIAFSLDGKLLASGYTRGLSSWKPRSPEGGTGIWDVKTGKFIGMRGIAASRQTLRFSADGTSIMTDVGRVDVRSFYKGAESAPSRNLAVFQNEWARVGNEAILLPNDYHATCAAATDDDLLIMGHASGKVTFLRAKVPERQI
ncbi:WD40 repeat domain-containing protein [Aspergillus vadensis CBS 113365]|uniref:WD40 repeat-like protein n=1 Tax=Aspergillus vadensis (strain CBS 113365 / IMI 142717 / IBT 24658) TaxID=1448311 RepID=A0A319BR70_ASPVC|nr:WD40 repeat-like protein [Aspergillus vadensis CBS 113365]PYH68293.1 WD40 repeat-like protein [Aspergillus vadensis CBS 113365]